MTENVEKTVRRAALSADRELVLRTPVDTGRARANWLASVGTPEDRTVDSVSPNGSEAMSAASSEISKYRHGRGSIFITNSLPYIGRLDEGSSAQAPQGMTAFAVEAARQVFRKARILR